MRLKFNQIKAIYTSIIAMVIKSLIKNNVKFETACDGVRVFLKYLLNKFNAKIGIFKWHMCSCQNETPCKILGRFQMLRDWCIEVIPCVLHMGNPLTTSTQLVTMSSFCFLINYHMVGPTSFACQHDPISDSQLTCTSTYPIVLEVLHPTYVGAPCCGDA